MSDANEAGKATKPFYKKWWGILGISFVALVLLGSLIGNNDKSETIPITNKADTATVSQPAPTIEAKPINNWSKSTEVDEMTNKTNIYASIISNNKIQLKFPYNTPNGSDLKITIRNQDSKDEALVVISKGQILSNEKIRVKFDESAPIEYSLNSSSCGSSDIAFINNSKSFINKINNSKKIILELPLYQEGNCRFYFDTEGLEWSK